MLKIVNEILFRSFLMLIKNDFGSEFYILNDIFISKNKFYLEIIEQIYKNRTFLYIDFEI